MEEDYLANPLGPENTTGFGSWLEEQKNKYFGKKSEKEKRENGIEYLIAIPLISN